MKKKGILFGALCLVMLFLVTGCGNKKAITTSDFKSKAEKAGYQTADVYNQYKEFGYVKEATVATKDGYQVEFYVLDNKSNAAGMFNTNKTTFENTKSGSATESSVELGNYSTYSLTSSDSYMYLSRVDNTLIYVKVPESAKDNVKSLIKELGY